MVYSIFRLKLGGIMNKKIDLFFNNSYVCSTNQSKTCKEAKEKYLKNMQRVLENNAGYSLTQEARARNVLANPQLLKAFFDRGL